MNMNSSYWYESVPDDENGGGGFVFRGREDDSDFSGLPGLQQQTQDTLSRDGLHVFTRLHTHTHTHTKRGTGLEGEAQRARLKRNKNVHKGRSGFTCRERRE